MKRHRRIFRFLIACGAAPVIAQSSYAGAPEPTASLGPLMDSRTSDGGVLRARDAAPEGELARTSSAPPAEESVCREDPEAWTSTAHLDATCPVDCLREALAGEPSVEGDASVTQGAEHDPASRVDPASNGLMSIDPSTFPAGVVPKYECVYDTGCELRPKCLAVLGGFVPDVGYSCIPTDCGPARCSSCPDWVAERLKNIVIKAWCAYVCTQSGTYPSKEVAIGAGGISSFKEKFVGLFCLKEIPKP